jgi:pimeloyl-ACP methyl ester carboxylesterase
MRLSASLKALCATLVCLCFLFVASAQAQVNQLPRAGRNPVILIPGIGGLVLENPRNGRVEWPRLRGESLRLPLCADPLVCPPSELVPTRLFRKERLAWFLWFLPKISIYDSLMVELERARYRPGQFAHPKPYGDRDTYYVLDYDWRGDVVEGAQLLALRIAQLKERLVRPDLRFDIVAHSTGGLIARYYAMYGDRDVLTSSQLKPDWAGAAHLDQMILLGTPNEGSMEAFRALLQGYSNSSTSQWRLAEWDRILLRKVSAEVLFTFPSIYQLLPHQGSARFFDENLSLLPEDLYDLRTWKQYGWSIAFDEEFREREKRDLIKRHGPVKGAQEADRLQAQRENFLRRMLARAAALHRALGVPATPPSQITIRFLGSGCRKTLAGALILNASSTSPKTVFRAKRAKDLLFEPGDGRVTSDSARLPYRCNNLPSEKSCGMCYGHVDLVSKSAATSLLPIILQHGRRADLLACQPIGGCANEIPVINSCYATNPGCY